MNLLTRDGLAAKRMVVKLRIVRGTLMDRRGCDAGNEIVVRSRRFVIGSASDCQLRCPSKLINPHHCAIEVEWDRIVVRDYESVHGTYVNRGRIESTTCVFHNDRLRIGRLEFEVFVVMQAPRLIPAPKYRLVIPPPARETVVSPTDTILERVAEKLAAVESHARVPLAAAKPIQ